MSHTFKDVPRTSFLGSGTPIGPQLVDPGPTPGQIVPASRTCVVFDDFTHTSISATAQAAKWHEEAGSGCTCALVGASDGVTPHALLSSDGTNGDTIVLASGVDQIFPSSTKHMYFETKVTASIVTENLFMGFAAMGNDGVPALGAALTTLLNADHFGVRFGEADASLVITMSDGSTDLSLDSGVDLVAATGTVLGLLYSEDGTVSMYVDGEQKFSSKYTTAGGTVLWSTGFPDVAMGLCVVEENTGNAATYKVEYIYSSWGV